MIIVDTSALVAIMLDEPENLHFAQILFGTETAVIAAPTAFEFRMVMTGRRHASHHDIELILQSPNLRIAAWTAEHATIAHAAFVHYGKGQGHPAQLNFGDCISYALAKAENAPLLYKGGDFALTDVRAAT